MSNGLECLRASKAAGDEQTETESRDCGKRWALDEAEYSDLRRVANLKTQTAMSIWANCAELSTTRTLSTTTSSTTPLATTRTTNPSFS